MACCRPSTIAKAHLGSSAYTILIAKTCAQKQSVDARDVRCLATRARDALIYKEIASWAARNAFPKWQEGRHPHCHFRGLLRLHSRYGPPDRSAAHRRPLSRGSNPCGYPHKPLVSYRINRQLSGWIPPPLMIRAFGAHCQQRTHAPQQRAALLDHLVGTREKRRWHIDSKRLGGFEIDHQLELGWPLDWQLTGVCACKNPSDIRRGLREDRRKIRTIGHQAAELWKRIEKADRRQSIVQGEISDVRALAENQG